MKVEITNIKVKLGERDIELTADEARKLHEELTLLFDTEKRSVLDEIKKLMPQKEYVYQPIVIERQLWPDRWYPYFGATCGTLQGTIQGGGIGNMLCINSP